MELQCSTCGAPFRAEDLNLDYGLATCRFCHSVTKLPKADREAESPPSSTEPRERGPVPMPKKITVEEWGGTLRLSWRWFSPAFFFLLFFCIAWDSFLVFWYWMATGGMGGAPGPFRLLFLIFPIAHVAVGVGLTYFVIAGFLNRTVLEVTPSELIVQHGPVPWRGNKRIPIDALDQLYCQAGWGRGSQDRMCEANGGRSVTFQVSALLKDGTKETIVSSLPDRDHALFIEQKVEETLRVQDRPIGGEL